MPKKVEIKFMYDIPFDDATAAIDSPQDYVAVIDVRKYRKYLVGGANIIGKLTKHLQVEYSYPINGKETFEFTCDGDYWTLDQLLRAIVRGYRYIYKAEKRYGVWGHFIEDLVIDAIYMVDDGKRIVLEIGS